jgi:hypothetical protein
MLFLLVKPFRFILASIFIIFKIVFTFFAFIFCILWNINNYNYIVSQLRELWLVFYVDTPDSNIRVNSNSELERYRDYYITFMDFVNNKYYSYNSEEARDNIYNKSNRYY